MIPCFDLPLKQPSDMAPRDCDAKDQTADAHLMKHFGGDK
jgi:hypothetical protein